MDIPTINEPWILSAGAVRIAEPPKVVESPDGYYVVTYTFEINSDPLPDVVVEASR